MTAMTDTNDCVLFEELPAANGGQLGIITLNTPETLNALTLGMVELMLAKLNQWQQDEQLACIVMRSNSDKAFCAGGDVQRLYRSAVENPGGPCAYAETFFEREYRLDYLLHTYPKPIIGWGHGIVMGGGLGVFAACSHRVVTETTRVAMPEITIGLYPDVGGSYFLRQMPGATGRFLALTGASINAADSLYLSLAEYFIGHTHYAKVIDDLLNTNWDADPTANKALVTRVLDATAKTSAPALPEAVVEPHREQIEQLCRTDITQETVKAISTLETEDKWLARARDSLNHGSPLSAMLIDRQLKLAKGLSLKEIFCSELVLSTNIVRGREFAEGVRALLIDKDRNPQWQFKDINAIPAELVESFFVSPWDRNPLEDL